jgi:hypothetical protein
VLGDGPNALYLNYLPVYRHRNEEHGEKVWPCKIGKTAGDPLSRVLAQASTALPEQPHIGVVVKTANASEWESPIQAALTIRGRRISESPGSEWFLTSPEEVLELIKSIDPRLA